MTTKEDEGASARPPPFVVAFTGLPPSERAELGALVHTLGGTVARALTPATTHVVCGAARTTATLRALPAGAACVTRAWLDACAAAGAALPETAPFAVPPLLGCVLCPSGLDARARAALQRAAAALGALVTLDLTTAATHVVATAAAVAARRTKVVRARALRAAVVRPAWVVRALALRTRPNEDDFGFPVFQDGSSKGGNGKDEDGLQELIRQMEREAAAEGGTTTKGPLSGCGVALVGMAPAQRVALKGVLRALGVTGTCALDAPHLTHVVLAPGAPHPTLPADTRVHVVGAHWLAACAQTHCRLAEDAFPPGSPTGVLQGSVVAIALDEGTSDGLDRNTDKTDTIEHCRTLLRTTGARCATECPGSPVNYIVSNSNTITISSKTEGPVAVSPTWLALCASTQSVLNPAYAAVLRAGAVPPHVLAGTEVVLSGFCVRGRAVWTATAERLGAHVCPALRRGATTVLVACPGCSSSAPKVRAAHRWGVPVATPAWLDACFQARARVPIDPFLLPGSVRPRDHHDDDNSSAPAPKRACSGFAAFLHHGGGMHEQHT